MMPSPCQCMKIRHLFYLISFTYFTQLILQTSLTFLRTLVPIIIKEKKILEPFLPQQTNYSQILCLIFHWSDLQVKPTANIYLGIEGKKLL